LLAALWARTGGHAGIRILEADPATFAGTGAPAMTDDNPPHDLAAGDFATWLAGMTAALRAGTATEVPCGDCTACCTSSQFVHVAPDETVTLARIPTELLFPAPGLPAGHVLMGYDEHGHCPMFVDGACSIYEDRPRTCRTYDCRVFAAAGLHGEPADKPAIAQRAGRWRFSFAGDDDRVRHAAVQAAAAYLAANHHDVATHATRRAVVAVEIHDRFMAVDDTGTTTMATPEADAVAHDIAIRTRRRPS
jgi:uncharacterized protein